MSQSSLNILYEDPSLIVCAKPHGIATQSKNIGARDMESMLKTYIYQHCSPKNKNYSQTREPYLAVIHRLDQPVSGILVFSKTPQSARALNLQLQKKQFRKYYRALTDGIPAKNQGVLEDYLVKDGRTNTSRICSPDSPGAKYARLEYYTVAVGASPIPGDNSGHSVKEECFFKNPSSDQAELEIHLDTGRHHQIRVQLASMGCPIAGDTKYHSLSSKAAPPSRETGAILQLCAFHLEFFHPLSGAPMSFHLTEDVGARQI